jgi:flagellar biosynthesis anti-sigma factor FlgM
MRITDAIIQSGAVDQLRKATGAKELDKPNGKDTSVSSRKDSVELSGKGRQISADSAEKSAVTARADALPEVRNEKIAEVREKIANGFYNSPEFTDKLADRLINDFWGEKS